MQIYAMNSMIESISYTSAILRCLDYPNIEIILSGIRNISAGEFLFVFEAH